MPHSMDLKRQRFNMDLIRQAKPKLESLQRLLHGKEFRMSALPKGLSKDVADFIERAEGHSLRQLLAYIKKCLDCIEFLEIVSQHEDVKSFEKLLSSMDVESLNLLSKLKYVDLVAQDNKLLIKNLLDKSIKVDSDGDSRRTCNITRMRADRVHELCSTMFSAGEYGVFLGESHLQTAITEKDVGRKGQLVKEAMEKLLKNPLDINFKTVVPLMVKNGNIVAIVQLVLEK